MLRLGIAVVAALSTATAATGVPKVPGDVMVQLPAGYEVLGYAVAAGGRPIHAFAILALGRRDETDKRWRNAPARPLLIFEQKRGRFVLVGRNDTVVLKADEGRWLEGDRLPPRRSA